MILPVSTWANDRAAQQQFSAVSLLLEQADNALEDEALEDAARLYGATVRAYQQFSKDYPTFAPDLVRFRIAYCKNQMQDIEKLQSQKAIQEISTQTTESDATTAKRIALSPDILDILRKNDQDAIRDKHRELRKNGHPAAQLLQAILQVQTGDFSAARNTLDKLLLTYPNDPAAHYNMAQIILRADSPDFGLAREHYRKAIENGAPRDEDLEIVINL